MKTVKKSLYPFLLVLTCCVVWYWQHFVASLPYLPLNCVLPLGIMTPLLLILTFLTSFVMFRQGEAKRPALRAVLCVAGMFVPLLATTVFFLSFLTYRFAAYLPVPVLPDWPTGIVTVVIASACIIHLTALLICRFRLQKTPAKVLIPSIIGWMFLNTILFLVTV